MSKWLLERCSIAEKNLSLTSNDDTLGETDLYCHSAMNNGMI
jgi:hypothetical protein